MTTPTVESRPAADPRAGQPRAAAADPRWQGLYRTGGAAALAIAILIVAGVATFFVWPPLVEGTVADWLVLFRRNWLAGMLGLDLVLLLTFAANIPVVLALYVALRRESESLMVLAATLGLVAIATYFASSRVFEMLALSRQYAAATAEAERSLLLAAGQSMLTTYLGPFAPPVAVPGWNYQGTAFSVSYALWSIAGVMISAAMLRGHRFGRAAGSVGIAGNLTALGLFLPAAGVLLSLVSLPVLLVWYVLIARGLFRLARAVPASRVLEGG